MLVLTSCTVITHPMDLQTMGRKVKSKAYLTKKAFADDLNLIWDNCLTYNSDPVRRFMTSWNEGKRKKLTVFMLFRIIRSVVQPIICAKRPTRSSVASQTVTNGSHRV